MSAAMGVEMGVEICVEILPALLFELRYSNNGRIPHNTLTLASISINQSEKSNKKKHEKKKKCPHASPDGEKEMIAN
jgi:hypothetical protein